jgi:hypothetical protein
VLVHLCGWSPECPVGPNILKSLICHNGERVDFRLADDFAGNVLGGPLKFDDEVMPSLRGLALHYFRDYDILINYFLLGRNIGKADEAAIAKARARSEGRSQSSRPQRAYA